MDDNGAEKPAARRRLTDDQIKTERHAGRRTFLRNLGAGLLGAAAFVASGRSASASDSDGSDSHHHDFPKGGADDDTSSLGDPKLRDNDSKDAGTDNDRSHLRDAKGSSDSD